MVNQERWVTVRADYLVIALEYAYAGAGRGCSVDRCVGCAVCDSLTSLEEALATVLPDEEMPQCDWPKR